MSTDGRALRSGIKLEHTIGFIPLQFVPTFLFIFVASLDLDYPLVSLLAVGNIDG